MARIDSLARGAFGVVRGGARLGGTLLGGVFGGVLDRARDGGVKSDMSDRTPAPKSDMDDKTLARKVETELFREAGAPKASVDVNVTRGVVELRGTVKHPEDVKDLEARARRIPEVREVENFLHLPKTPAPTRTDTPARQRKTQRSTKRSSSSTRPRRARTRTTAEPEREARGGEASPDELAARREGRQPAPMGSQDSGGGASDTKATPPAERTGGKPKSSGTG